MNKQIVKKDGPTINKIIKKDGSTVYRANIYLGIDANTGKSVRTSITAKTQKAIKLKASKAINDFQNNGCTRLAKVSCKTFDELIQLWWNNHKLSLKNNTVTSNQNFINSYISPALGAYSISKISTSLIQNQMNIWANNANSSKLYTTGSTKSYSVLLNIITRIFQYGISIGVVTFNPARDVILPRIKRQENKKIKYF
ncbi:MAG: site-specific integrase, partial [Erysipelotrichia bacterium]|nr:site-specific integrase [Erysipelotrichia bacterium]